MVLIPTSCRTFISTLPPKYVDGPDYGGIFQMNPGKVYLSDAEYSEMVEALRKELV